MKNINLIRFFDIIFSTTALLLLSPLLMLVIITLKLTGEREVFYLQKRIGRFGAEFNLIKFVTMIKNSSEIGTGELTLPKDERILPVGFFLRKTKINELPQLINVLLGDISLIGPRPQTKLYFNCYTSEDQEYIKSVRPGLSGIGSIIFRDEEMIFKDMAQPKTFDMEIIMPYKGELERWFVVNRSLALYLKLIFLTMKVVVFPNAKISGRLTAVLPKPPSQLIPYILLK